ncbi:MAG TPA: hypothetical protein VM285_10135 [Polyangia bacterium]|nr:hypothetical protein [Polyangia bacterium]
MTASAEKPPLALSLLLLLAGAAALATAVLLVWARFEPRGVAGPAPAVSVGPAVPAVVEPEPPPLAPSPPDAAVTGPADAGAVEPPGGPWRVVLDPQSYAPDEDGERTIAAVAGLAAADPQARFFLVGVNSNRRSEKRALQAARVMRDRLVAAGVERRRCEVSAEQSATIEGLEVRIELRGVRR